MDSLNPWVLVAGDFVLTGGMDRANAALAQYLADSGTPTHLVGFRADASLLNHRNITFHAVPKPAGSYTLGLPLLDLFGRRIARRLAREQGARVLVNGGGCRFGDINWVHYVHAAYRPLVQAGAIRSALRAYNHRAACSAERAALRQARVVIADSQLTRRNLLEHELATEDRVHTVYYGVDAGKFHPVDASQSCELRHQLGFPTDRPLVVFVGGMSDRRKGFDTIFAAWPAIRSEIGADPLLLAVGGGAEVAAWQHAADAAGFGRCMRFLGRRDDVPKILQCSDLMLAPTRYEPYGLAVHEALCCGIPAIVSAGAGVAERYPPQLCDLLLNDPASAVELAERVRNWWNDRGRYAATVATLGDTLRRRSWSDASREILQAAKALPAPAADCLAGAI